MSRATVRSVEAVEVRSLGDVVRDDLDVGIHGLGSGLEAGFELLDQTTDALDATDETELPGCALQCRSGTDQERTLLLGEDQTGDVVAIRRCAGRVGREVEHGGVDDAERLVGVGLSDSGGIGLEEEADRDDDVTRLQQRGRAAPCGSIRRRWAMPR